MLIFLSEHYIYIEATKAKYLRIPTKRQSAIVISPINIRCLNECYDCMVTIFSWLFQIWCLESKWCWINECIFHLYKSLLIFVSHLRLGNKENTTKYICLLSTLKPYQPLKTSVWLTFKYQCKGHQNETNLFPQWLRVILFDSLTLFI